MAGYLFSESKKGKAKTSIKKVAKVSKKVLKALEKARKARARKRKQALRKKREKFLKPFYSEITGKRYKTKAGMERAEAKKSRDFGYRGRLIPKIILDAEATLDRDWYTLGYRKNVWSHFNGILALIFNVIQDYDWDNLYEGTIRKAYNDYGLDTKYDGHSLRDFITLIMGIEDTNEMVSEDGEKIETTKDIFEIEVDFS